jgi:hypothetical protein
MLGLCLLGCAREPKWYAVPQQRPGLAAAEEGALGAYVIMNAPNADAHLLGGVSHYLEGGAWRWVGERARLRFFLESNRNQKLSIDFSITEFTFKETGPVTLSFLINGHPFDTVRYDSPGDKRYWKDVPEALLRAGADNVVSIGSSPVWTSREDGTRLSVVLKGAGFVD